MSYIQYAKDELDRIGMTADSDEYNAMMRDHILHMVREFSKEGHSHGTLPDDPNSKSFDVGVDCHNFMPISLERVLHLMSKKKVEQNFENLPGVKAGIIRE